MLLEKLYKSKISTTDSDVTVQMALQLHEQHAQNENSRNGNVIAFLAAIIGAVAGFGYVVYNLGVNPHFNKLCCFTEWVICMAAISACIVLSGICAYNISHGYTTRRDSLVMHRLRDHYGDLNSITCFKLDEDKGLCGYLPESNIIIFWFIQVVILFICVACLSFFSFVFKIVCISTIITIIINIGLIFVNFVVLKRYYRKYKEQLNNSKSKERKPSLSIKSIKKVEVSVNV